MFRFQPAAGERVELHLYRLLRIGHYDTAHHRYATPTERERESERERERAREKETGSFEVALTTVVPIC
jgi:hypothetical protein